MVVFIIIATIQSAIVEWIFITMHAKGLVVWVCKTNGEFEWYRHRLLGGTTNVCERLLLERGILTLFFPCLFELTA